MSGAVGTAARASEGRTQFHSPEQVALDIEIAGPMSRALAFSIDYGLILLIEALVVFAVVMFLMTLSAAEPYLASIGEWFDGEESQLPWSEFIAAAVGLFMVFDFVAQFVYFVSFDLWMQGRSPGKVALGLRVVSTSGLPLEGRASLLRNLMRTVDMLPNSYLVGFVAMLASSKAQRLGDHAADTLVVRESRARRAAPIVLANLEERKGSRSLQAVDSFRLDRDHVARLGAAERRLLRQTLRKLADLSEAERPRFAERTTEVLRRRIGWEGEIAASERVAFLVALMWAIEPPEPGPDGRPGS